MNETQKALLAHIAGAIDDMAVNVKIATNSLRLVGRTELPYGVTAYVTVHVFTRESDKQDTLKAFDISESEMPYLIEDKLKEGLE